MCFPGSLLKWLPISLSLVGGADGVHRGGLEGKQKLRLFWPGREPKFVYLTSPALGIRGWGCEGGRLGRVAKSGMQLVPSPWGKAHFISECSQSANVLSTLLAARDVTHLRQNVFLLLLQRKSHTSDRTSFSSFKETLKLRSLLPFSTNFPWKSCRRCS